MFAGATYVYFAAQQPQCRILSAALAYSALLAAAIALTNALLPSLTYLARTLNAIFPRIRVIRTVGG